jgi:hypothetical protein
LLQASDHREQVESGRVAEAVDPYGRRVRFHDEAVNHVLVNHPEMRPYLDEIMATISRPDWRELDFRPARERYYKRGAGSSRRLVVVVDFRRSVGRVVTAYATRKGPRERHTR